MAGGGGETPVRRCRHAHAARGCEGAHDALGLGVERLVLARLVERGEGHVVERATARMQVEPGVALRHQHLVDVVRDLPGGRAVGVAGEGAIEIAGVERRDACPRHRRRQVGRRQDQDPALDVGGLELADQAHERDLAFVLVAVVAPPSAARSARCRS